MVPGQIDISDIAFAKTRDPKADEAIQENSFKLTAMGSRPVQALLILSKIVSFFIAREGM